MRAGVGVGTFLSGGPNRDGTSIRVTASRSEIVFFRGSGSPPSQAKIDAVMRRHARKATEEVVDRTHEEIVVRMQPHRKSGRSIRSVNKRVIRVGDEYLGVVESDYLPVIVGEGGSGIYGPKRRMIRPRTAQRLRFPNRGTGAFTLTDTVRTRGGRPDPRARYIYTRAVRGQRPKHWFRDTLRVVRVDAPRIYRRHARVAAQEALALV